MDILKRYESDDFDESYDFDDLESQESEERGSSRPFLVRAFAMIVAVTGIAYGANIALNGGNNGQIEFGQGFVNTTAVCDTNGGITVTPYAGYVNEANGTGKFTLDSIIFENVDDTCVGEDFTIQVWSNAGADALTLSETASAGSYVSKSSVRFYFQDSATVVMKSNQYTDIELLTDVTSNEFTNDQSSFQLVFDPDQTSAFADATEVYKITVQTSPHNSAND
jgi:hypothetical protein